MQRFLGGFIIFRAQRFIIPQFSKLPNHFRSRNSKTEGGIRSKLVHADSKLRTDIIGPISFCLICHPLFIMAFHKSYPTAEMDSMFAALRQIGKRASL